MVKINKKIKVNIKVTVSNSFGKVKINVEKTKEEQCKET